MSDTIIAAWIGGGFTLLGAILTSTGLITKKTLLWVLAVAAVLLAIVIMAMNGCFSTNNSKIVKPVPIVVNYYELSKKEKNVDKKISYLATVIITDSSNRCNAYIDRATIYYEQEQYTLAVNDIKNAIELEPNNGTALNLLGLLEDRNGKFTEAIENFTTAINKGNKNHTYIFYLNRAHVKINIKNYDSAIDDCNKSIKLNPSNSTSYYARGLAYELKKKYLEALFDYAEALKIDANSKNAKEGVKRVASHL